MLAHKTLKTNRFVEQFLIFWAVFNGSGHPASWVAYHRLHHSVTDTPRTSPAPSRRLLVGASSLALSDSACRQEALGSGTHHWYVQNLGMGRNAGHCLSICIGLILGFGWMVSSGWARSAWSTRFTCNAW